MISDSTKCNGENKVVYCKVKNIKKKNNKQLVGDKAGDIRRGADNQMILLFIG